MREFWHAFVSSLPGALGDTAGATVSVILISVAGWLIRSALRRPHPERTPAAAAGSAAPVSSAGTPAWTVPEYLQDLIRSGSTLAFGDPASSEREFGESAGIITLEQLWTPLRAADSRSHETGGPLPSREDGLELREILDSGTEPVMILGDPGGGKSTAIASIAVNEAREYAAGRTRRLPVRVQLSRVLAESAGDAAQMLLSGVPEVALTVARHGGGAGEQLRSFLRTEILEGRALLLLDGLDEVKEQSLGTVRRAISQILLLGNATRTIATCRTFDYRQSAPARKIAIQRELELLPFTRLEQNRYVDQWYDAAARIGRFPADRAAALARELKRELVSPELAELAELPLLLALLTLLHSREGKLPGSRAVVCDRAIRYLLAVKATWRETAEPSAERSAEPDGTVADAPLLTLAVNVAHHLHLGEESGRSPLGAGVTLDEIREQALAPATATARRTGGTTDPDRLADRLLRSHGLLSEVSPGRYRFAHRYFQEFLAGQYYARGARPAQALAKARAPHWREPFRLMASFAGHEGENIFYVLTLVDELLGHPRSSQDPVNRSQLAAEMLVEIGRNRLSALGFDHVLAMSEPADSADPAGSADSGGSAGGVHGLWQRAGNALSAQVENSGLTVAERYRAAAAIGHLGDPRFTTASGATRGPWQDLIRIPAGTASIGTTRLPAADTLSAGRRELDFPAFGIGRYPVTNAQYAEFLDSGGYREPSYWQGRMATGWVRGDRAVLEEMRVHWLETVHLHHVKELRDGEIDEADLRAESAIRVASRDRPYYWDDRRFNQPGQPVVGINFWEASAYCAWATGLGHRDGSVPDGTVLCLPTEFEWERACRPADDDRIYPWGDDPSDGKVHLSTNPLNIRQPCPVGIYLESWDSGPCDLGGNVWEWTTSLHRSYLDEHDPHRTDPDSLGERIVRGSSWYNTFTYAACSSRAVDRSYNLFYDVGFRVAAVPASAPRAGHP